MRNAFSEAEASYKARVIHATFGHLDPNPGEAYRGGITVAVGHRDTIIMDYKFPGLPDSPLLAMTMQDIFDRIPKKARPGSVYAWVGHLIRYKNGKARLTKGTMGKCKIVHPFDAPKAPAKPKKKHRAIIGHEYLAQGHGAYDVTKQCYPGGFEVLDLTENTGVPVFLAKTYEECVAWIDA